jgi:hypothetical protein
VALKRIQLARGFVGKLDPLEYVLSWRTPEERLGVESGDDDDDGDEPSEAGNDPKNGVITGWFAAFRAVLDSALVMGREQAGIANSGRRRWQSRP